MPAMRVMRHGEVAVSSVANVTTQQISVGRVWAGFGNSFLSLATSCNNFL